MTASTTQRWAAFLRGINVGGRNKVVMAELRAELLRRDVVAVRTYIQSGNLLIDLDRAASAADVAELVEIAVADVADIRVPVRVRAFDDLVRISTAHPGLGGDVPSKWLLVVLLDGVPTTERPDLGRFAPDRVDADGTELHLTYPNGVGRSKLTLDLVEREFGVSGTARNVTTLAKLVEIGRSEKI